jgi:predicted enzyme related to lactoylglutathione lyase
MSPGSRPLGTLAWVDLATPDVESAADFYSRLLGWKLEAADTPMGRYVIGLIGAAPAAGMMAQPPDQVGPPPAWTAFFAVANVEEAYDQAGRLGATGLQPPTTVPGGDRIAVVTDPAGAVVGLIESHAGDSMAWGERGAVAWVENQSRDVQASGAFYERLLGWIQGPEIDGYRVFGRDGEQVAGLMAMPTEVPAEAPSYWLIYFAVDDVDRARARVGELGGSDIVPVMTVQDMRFAVAEDPFGAVFALLETSG